MFSCNYCWPLTSPCCDMFYRVLHYSFLSPDMYYFHLSNCIFFCNAKIWSRDEQKTEGEGWRQRELMVCNVFLQHLTDSHVLRCWWCFPVNQKRSKRSFSPVTPLFLFRYSFFLFFNKQHIVFVYRIRKCDCQHDSVVVVVSGSCCHISGYIGVWNMFVSWYIRLSL